MDVGFWDARVVRVFVMVSCTHANRRMGSKGCPGALGITVFFKNRRAVWRWLERRDVFLLERGCA